VFSIGDERYGIETARVIEVLGFTELTRVPCTPPFVLGVVNHRGRIVPVLDLQRLFGGAGSDATAEGRVVTVEAGGMTFGILAAAVTGSIRIGADDLAPAPAAPVGGSSLVRGVTAEMVAVLDVDALVRDPRIVVNEEVG
jgi:purine-binding chemotaxis protein CheW